MHRTCAVCGLSFERGPGYFVGGLELHWVSTYVIAAACWFPLRPLLPDDELTGLLAYMVFVVAMSLSIYRPCRSLWMAIDNLVDPVEREYLEMSEELDRIEEREKAGNEDRYQPGPADAVEEE